MLLFTHIDTLKAYLLAQKRLSKSIGLVPTMGALHQGHISLIAQSIAKTDITVCSIFVNPTQFNNVDDLQKYPRTLEDDMLKLVSAGCHVLFHPTATEIYPDGLHSLPHHWGNVTHSLEGASRPGHFDGVITVVKKLFDIVTPDFAFFGKKDYQQCAVIQRMVKEFNLPISIILSETFRELDGLAMSSRNVRLTANERREAVLVSQSLFYIKQYSAQLPKAALLANALKIIAKGNLLKLEYLSIVDAETLEDFTVFIPGRKYVALIALWCGNVRLIDNIVLGE